MKFTPEMFGWINGETHEWSKRCAVVANELFTGWLESQPKVYGQNIDKKDFWSFSRSEESFDTHTARLVCVEPIEKKECDHLPDHYDEYGRKPICRCGKVLEPTGWRVKK